MNELDDPPEARLHPYLADAHVRRRMVEFLGGRSLADATCHYVAPASPTAARPFAPRPPAELWSLLAEEGEAARSLWDRRSLLVHLDVEHVHYDRPAEALADRARSRTLLRPTVATIVDLLAEHGIEPLHVLTGRGHHWLWRISRRSRELGALARLGSPGQGLRRWYRSPRPPLDEAVGEATGAAFDGLGKVLEHLAHRILAGVAGRSPIPVQITAATVPGAGPHGREAVSVDLSLFGDPLDRRGVRLPFSPYLKGRRFGEPALLASVVAPPGEEDAAFAAVCDLEAAAELAHRTRATIPDASAATPELVRSYLGSPLAAVHDDYYRDEPDAPERWPDTYDRLDLASLPACVARILGHPNDLALQPAAIELVVRVLVALGWRPRHVAGLLRSKYERDHGWIAELHFHEPGCRADFYVRLFTGLAALAPGDSPGFGCDATVARSLCPDAGCGWDLGRLEEKLRGRWNRG